ncbi:nuclear transport factor 2 family protein [Segetibacter aerophilus]|uniref:nuclear transport factor 2 family protein n=1 Tax=Segetibacter aerophilus TaxID=670293 RepID=UPI0011BFA7ED|nr:nuclear transport factor 2 family protein [Segetibacter aerophilus]
MLKKSCLFLFLVLSTVLTFAQAKEEQAVAQQVEKLRKAMIDGDQTALQNLTSDKLTYGHSSGTIEDKKLFIGNIVNKKSSFATMDLTNQTISISDNVALVRHKLDAVTSNDGKPAEAHLFVLLVWQKTGGQWKLVARQAVKQPVETAAAK